MDARARGVSLVLSGLFAFVTVGSLVAEDPPPSGPSYQLTVVATGLRSPDGLAIHPTTRELWFTEEDAGLVSVLRDGRPRPVISTFRVDTNFPAWLITSDRPRETWLSGRLASPEGLAFAPDGSVYVVEDSPRGRVLHFRPEPDGQFRTARVVPLPWLDEPYAWESIAVGPDGRLYLAGSAQEAQPGIGSSCVLTRDTSNDWWVIDYGPFASFSAVATAPAEDILVAADESSGTVTWWDTDRRQELLTIPTHRGPIEGVCVLPDGALALAVESTPEAGGRILRSDPVHGTLTPLAEGLASIESVLCDDRTGVLYVTEDGAGRILRLTPDTPPAPGHDRLRMVRRSGEARRGLPPRQPPPFLKSMMSQVGVHLVDQASDKSGAPHQMTLEELGRRIPLVAGQVKVEPMPGVDDPITELRFINLFPNQVTLSGPSAAPSLCLFVARHQSGRIDRSQPLTGFHATKRSPDGEWKTISRNALLMLPLTTCSATEDENGVAVTMSFLGLDRFGDCFLTVNYGQRNEARLAVSGAQLVSAAASISERGPDGGEVVHFAMAGVRPRRSEDCRWLNIGRRPHWALVSPGLDIWIPRWTRTHLPDLVERLRDFNREVLASCSEPPPPAPAPAVIAGQATPTQSAPPAHPPAGLQAERRNRRDGSPLAIIRFPDPSLDLERENVMTNLIISRLTEAWQQQTP